MPRLGQEHIQTALPFLVSVGFQSVLWELCVFQRDNFRESSGLQFKKKKSKDASSVAYFSHKCL